MLGILKNKRLFGNAFWALFGQLGSALALLAGTRILTELVNPEIYGQVALLNGFIALGVSLFAYPFICAGMRILPECLNRRERGNLYRVVGKLAGRSTALAVLLLALGGGAYAYQVHGNGWLIVLMCFLLAATVRREIGIQLLIGEARQRDASLWQTSDSILRPVLAITMAWLLGANAAWILLGYILASLINNTLWAFVHDVKVDDGKRHGVIGSRNLKKDILTYALPLIPMELIFWVNGLGDRYIIGYMMTAADVGLYAASYTLVNEAFNRSAMVLLRTFQPAYFQASSDDNPKTGFRLLWTWIACVIAMGIAGIFAVIFLKDWIANLLLAKTYHSAASLMPVIGLGCALHALGTVLAQPLLAGKQTKKMLAGRLCGTVTAVISIPLLVKYYGLMGAAMANPIYFGVEATVLAMMAKPWRSGASKLPEETGEALAACRISV